MSDVRQIASFLAQDLFFGVDVLQVQEIIRQVAITRVPLAPPMVSGLINMRGQIVTALDLRRCLGMPERPSGQPPAGLILQAEEGLVGLIVDEVGTVFELPEDAFEPPPEMRIRMANSPGYSQHGRVSRDQPRETLARAASDRHYPDAECSNLFRYRDEENHSPTCAASVETRRLSLPGRAGNNHRPRRQFRAPRK
jgi:purine-binding chemotaxis protein CheW